MLRAEDAWWGKRNVHIFLAGEAEGRRPLGSYRSRWESVIIDLKATGWERIEWIYLAYNTEKWWAVMNAVMKFRVSEYLGVWKFLE